MPHPIPLPVRQVIVQRAEQGQSAGLIARSLGLVSRSVRQLLQRLRMQGNNALLTSYPGRVYPHPPQFRPWSRRPYSCVVSTQPGARAWCVCGCVGTIPRPLSRRNARCNGGSGVRG